MKLEDIMCLRKNQNDGYFFFYDCILRCVVAKMKWKHLVRRNLPIDTLITVSDEAFALLVLENGWEKWTELHKDKTTDKKARKKKKSLYTNDVREGNSSFDGWKPEGLDRFNMLVYKVIRDRKSVEGKAFDKQYNDGLLQASSAATRKKKRPPETDPEVMKRNKIELYNPNLETCDQFEQRMEKQLKDLQSEPFNFGASGAVEHGIGDGPENAFSALLHAGANERADDIHETEEV